MSKARKRLGKGLDALLPSVGPEAAAGIRELPVEEIRPNPYQPRREFDETALAELSASVSRHGIVQPVVVVQDQGAYILVAGERRWRAAQRAGLATVPAVVRELDPLQMTEVALIENLQREDLNPIEEAHAYQTLQDEFGLTQEQIAQRVGKSRSQIANTLRLLHLDPEVQQALIESRISPGHAKVILGVADQTVQKRLVREVAGAGMTVRRLEERVRVLTSGRKGRQSSPRRRPTLAPDLAALAEGLQKALGTRVALEPPGRNGRGRIIIEFYSDEDLERLYDHLTTPEHRTAGRAGTGP